MNEDKTHWLVTYNIRKVRHTKWYTDKKRTKLSSASNVEKGPWETSNAYTPLEPVDWLEMHLQLMHEAMVKGQEAVYVDFNTWDIVFLSAIRVRWSGPVHDYMEEV